MQSQSSALRPSHETGNGGTCHLRLEGLSSEGLERTGWVGKGRRHVRRWTGTEGQRGLGRRWALSPDDGVPEHISGVKVSTEALSSAQQRGLGVVLGDRGMVVKLDVEPRAVLPALGFTSTFLAERTFQASLCLRFPHL